MIYVKRRGSHNPLIVYYKETILIIGVDKIDEATAILKQHWINFVGDRIYSL
jgi:hypothetical protein